MTNLDRTQLVKPNLLAAFPVAIRLPIQWGDQDAFGHVNNTVPFRWYESARIAYLEQSGLESLMDGNGLGPILASITCHFRRQMHYPDHVWVGARATRLGRTSLAMDHAVVSERQQRLTADGTSTIVLFDYSANRPTRMSAELRRAVEQIEGRSFGEPEGESR